MTLEESINKQLQDALTLSLFLEEGGRNDLAKAVMATASKMATVELQLIPRKPVIQCRCGRKMKTADEIAQFEAMGECLHCDHVYGDSFHELYED